jgi:hypothetical protein
MSVDEIHRRDLQLVMLLEGMRERLSDLEASSRRQLDLDEVQDTVRLFENGLDSFLMELKGLAPDVKKNYKRKLKEHKQAIDAVKKEIAEARVAGTRNDLLGKWVPVFFTYLILFVNCTLKERALDTRG